MQAGEMRVYQAVRPARVGAAVGREVDRGCHPQAVPADPEHLARVAALAARHAAGLCLFEDRPLPVDEYVERRGQGRRPYKTPRFEFVVRLPDSPSGGRRTRLVRFGDVGCVNCAGCGVLLVGEGWEWVRAAVVSLKARQRLPGAVAGRVAGRPVCEDCRPGPAEGGCRQPVYAVGEVR